VREKEEEVKLEVGFDGSKKTISYY